MTMSKYTLLAIFGLMILFIPIIGFPRLWEEFFLVILGVFIISLAINLRRIDIYQKPKQQNIKNDVFVENGVKTSSRDNAIS